MRKFISDTHFGHEDIIRLSDRPFRNVSHMNETLVDNWNDRVGKKETIFHLGDVALGPWVEWDSILTRLNGYKILVVGNHDRVFKGSGKKGQKIRDRFAPLYAGWFDEVWDNIDENVGLELDNGMRVNLSHFPYDGDSHGEERYREFRLPDNGTPLIHGHTHLDQKVSRSNKGTLQIHVGADAWDYAPVGEDEIIDLIKGNV